MSSMVVDIKDINYDEFPPKRASFAAPKTNI
jgi:hypothetical protein